VDVFVKLITGIRYLPGGAYTKIPAPDTASAKSGGCSGSVRPVYGKRGESSNPMLKNITINPQKIMRI
jgi:hypothetical protein